MKTTANRYALASALIGLMSATTHADLISDTSYDGDQNSLVCLFNGTGTDACDPANDAIGYLGDSGWITDGPFLDPNDEYITSAAWTIGSSTGSFAKIIIEIAGNALLNTFGMYDLNDPNNRLELFSGSSTGGNRVVVEYLGDGDYLLNLGLTGAAPVNLGSSSFGWYLGVPDVPYLFFSDASLNPDGFYQMVAFQGGNDRYANFFNAGSAPWLSNEWVLAWEDLPYATSDKDFNDFVVLVESVAPVRVPEPGTLALFGAGLLFSAGFTKRRRQRAP